ncbi:MAG: UvrD-helicase domain-containing protein [Clostridia bacterium]|jgi:ATP-dependent helicase/nuclease subunit A
MISKVIKDKIDIDKILIVTFTNAAASEMRERILDAIYKQIDENPEDEALQKQIILLNKASICTIHSFCLDVIRNHFYELDIPANFRVGDTGEIELLKQDVIEELFEEKYLNNDKEFIKLINTYTNYRDDESLKELIITIYKFIQSSPFPKEWIEEKVKMFKIDDITDDFSGTIWGKILLESLSEDVKDCIIRLENLAKEMKKFDELEKYIKVIQNDTYELQSLLNNLNTWDSAYNHSNIEWMKWPVDRKVTIELKDEAKKIRDDIKKKISSSINKVLLYNSEVANNDIKEMYSILNSLKNLILEFSDRFKYKKREKNIIDFNDIEHFALELLVKKDDKGNLISTEIANEYKEKFEEIAIDEYQDSNLVQEYILRSISKGNNIFMVGDVKQSIYKFRQARPELFLEKYEKYSIDKEQGRDLKIKLFKNFRSRQNILDFTNLVFDNIMTKEIGDILYDKDEYLNMGANYEPPENIKSVYAGITNLEIIDLKEDDDDEEENDSSKSIEKNESDEPILENSVIEAKYVANRINELLNNPDYVVYDKKIGYRKITYKDIVILLRATSTLAPIYEKEITALNIPVFSDTSSEFLDSIEVQTILSVLKIIDNPTQDIPFVSVLRSSIGGFTDDELVKIRLCNKESNFYEAFISARIQCEENLKLKIENFLEELKSWQNKVNEKPLDELIWNIYMETNYYNYVRLNAKWRIKKSKFKDAF